MDVKNPLGLKNIPIGKYILKLLNEKLLYKLNYVDENMYNKYLIDLIPYYTFKLFV